MNSAASQSSNSGCVGGSLRVPKSAGEFTRGSPKCSIQTRFTSTRGVRGLPGDVMARAVLRRTEAQRSIQFVRESLQKQSKGPLRVEPGPPARDSCVVSLVEGWRGEIAHLALTDAEGDLRRYQFVDPSVHNWYALAMVMRGRQISDFPLCNKSFDLSYAGHDL